MGLAIVRTSPLLLLTMLIASCAHTPMSLVSLDGSQTNDLSRVSLITEDHDNPALLRGVDGTPLKSLRIPSALGEYAYVMSAGNHVLWVKGTPYPHPLIPQRIRCYVLHVALVPGGRYVLREDVAAKKAFLVRTETGEIESTGGMVDEPWVFARDCKWN